MTYKDKKIHNCVIQITYSIKNLWFNDIKYEFPGGSGDGQYYRTNLFSTTLPYCSNCSLLRSRPKRSMISE